MSTEIIVKLDTGDLVPRLEELLALLRPQTQAPAQAPAQAGAQPPAAPPQAPGQAAVPTTAPTYTIEQLAVAATPLIDGGRRQELVNLLGAFGVRALTELPKERYGEFATALRQLGAKI